MINPSKRHKLDLGLKVERISLFHVSPHSRSLSFLSAIFPSQNGDLAPSPCLSLGSWVRVFTHTFSIYFPSSHPHLQTMTSREIPHVTPRVTALSCGKALKEKKNKSGQFVRMRTGLCFSIIKELNLSVTPGDNPT